VCARVGSACQVRVDVVVSTVKSSVPSIAEDIQSGNEFIDNHVNWGSQIT
jgi:hypothetical protein